MASGRDESVYKLAGEEALYPNNSSSYYGNKHTAVASGRVSTPARPSTADSGNSSSSARTASMKSSVSAAAYIRSVGKRGKLAQHHNSSQVAGALNPVRGVRDVQRRLGQEPTDFAKSNAQRVRAMSARNAMTKRESHSQPAREHTPGHIPRSVRLTSRQRGAVQDGSHSPAASSDSAHRVGELQEDEHESHTAANDEGITADANAYEEDTVDAARCSSGGSSPSTGKMAGSKQRDFVRENAAEVASKAASPRTARGRRVEADPDFTKREGYGKVPNYLIQRKVELAREAEAKRAAQEAEAVPAGMRVMPEDERQETLQLLAKSKREAYDRLQQMPFVCETPSQKRAKEETEKRITELEEAERAFARKRVLVKADE